MTDSIASIELRKVSVTYRQRKGRTRTEAVKHASFAIHKGEAFGLIGESGSGKSTIARAILGLTPISGGTIKIGPWAIPDRVKWKQLRKIAQMIFQDPTLSLNPRMSVLRHIEEPMKIHGLFKSKKERLARILELIQLVGLDRTYLEVRPKQLSGGQRQRVCIARALAVRPQVLVADEPTSALDLSVQGQIIDLLQTLYKRQGLTLLFISHDIQVVRFLCHRVAVMYRGHIVEIGLTEEIIGAPLHPYTRLLIDSTPTSILRVGKWPSLEEEDETIRWAPGCPFYHRCARADIRCYHIMPPLIPVSQTHSVACYKFAH